MPVDTEAALRRKINELVARLPPSFVYSLLSEIEHMDHEPAERVRLVRQYVIEYLNRQRTNRARRLFTTLLEPFLVDDDVLFHAGGPVPGLVQRVDVGALWEVLSADAFPLVAIEAQEALDDAASNDLIDRVLRAPRALDLRERMRAAAVRHLDTVLANRKALDALLQALSRNRPRRTKMLSAFLDKPAPFAVETLALMRDLLQHAGGAAAEVAERLEQVPPVSASDWERERCAEALAKDAAAIRDRHAHAHAHAHGEAHADAGGERLAALLPLSVVNVRRNYAVAALYIRHAGGDAARAAAPVAALNAHYLGCVRALTAGLTGILKLNERVPGSPIRPAPKDRARLEGLVQRIAQLLEALTLAGLTEDRRTEPTYRLAWEGAARVLAARVAGVALERCSALAASRRQPATDHAEVVWLVRFLWTWYGMARGFELETFDLHTWRETLLEEMKANLEKALKFDPAEPLDERMAHLLRIDAVCNVFGQRVTAWIPASSHNMTQLVAHRLSGGARLSAEEQALIDDVVAAARTEVGRNRYWKSDELMGLIELAERVGA